MQAIDSPIRFRLITLAESILDADLGDDYARLRMRLDRFTYKRKDVGDDREEPALISETPFGGTTDTRDFHSECIMSSGSRLGGHIFYRNMD